ncbi:AI-2E family transporter [Coxiella burnetii]|uniref:AI-2E family transporter n=1 Tax=Coxiella burnetii TaxID=777 RepID=UPI0021ADE076|nr:AI-2E family transporter [Coxiella burnetii]
MPFGTRALRYCIVFLSLRWASQAQPNLRALDGNLLVPLLFSEAMDLHPIMIILSILVFGGIWGFWRIFFAIPLATLVKMVLNAWPKARISQNDTPG